MMPSLNNDTLIIRLPLKLHLAYKDVCKAKNLSISDDIRSYIQSCILPVEPSQPVNLPSVPLPDVTFSNHQKVNSALNAARLRKKKRK